MGKRKRVKAVLRLQIEAGKATPAPPIGPALGQHSVNIMEFCRAYNERTAGQAGMIIPAELTVYEDRTFTFVTKTPPASALIKRAAGVERGSANPLRDKVGRLTRAQAQEIAETKLPDLNAHTLDAALRMVEGSARSMGVEVVE